MPDRRLELDERVGLVVAVVGVGFARLAEIGIVADSTLVPIANNVGNALAGGRAQRTIAANANMGRPAGGAVVKPSHKLERLTDWNEPVPNMRARGVFHALVAVVPVGAVQALVTNTSDGVLTPIADGVMHLATASIEAGSNLWLKTSAFNSWNEGMLGVMSVTVLGEAGSAKVKVVTGSAMNKLDLGQILDAAVASANARVQALLKDGNDALGSDGCGG